jgi:hydrogenase-1 operon protein HyaF
MLPAVIAIEEPPMKPFAIPVVALGPGSQPGHGGELNYPALPKMDTFRMPEVPSAADPRDLAAAAALIERLIEPLARGGEEPVHVRLPLDDVAPQVVRLINESLGQGDVSAIVTLGQGESLQRWHIQESVFAGLWRVQGYDTGGRLTEDRLEICPIPGVIRDTLGHTATSFELEPAPAGAMNAPALLRELQHRLRERVATDPAHVINLTLLPLTPEDLATLQQHLGHGPVTILSRGFGNCRIGATALRDIWRVQYFNSMDTLILDTIEVTDVPAVALAAAEDFPDIADRLRELVEWMRE